MMETTELSQLFGKEIVCACGQTHHVETQGVYYGPVEDITRYIPKGAGQALLVCDVNTRRVAGQTALDALQDAGIEADLICLEPEGELHADEWALKQTRRAAQGKGFLLAVGAGTLGDITRYTAHAAGVPFATLATAASMDGFTSSVSPIIQNGFKRTVPGVPPRFLFADSGILLDAPLPMTAAGVGDMAGKLTALLDWKLATISEQEYYCGFTSELTEQAASRCVAAAEPWSRKEPGAAKALLDGLALSGIAMQMVGNSRPASGCEHHLAHFLEMRDMQRNVPARLHGARVGMATLLMLRLYRRFFETLPTPKPAQPMDEAEGRRVYGVLWPELLAEEQGAKYAPFVLERERLEEQMQGIQNVVFSSTAQEEEIRKAIASLGGPVEAVDLDYSREDIREGLLWCCYVRPRMTLLRLLQRWGVLADLVDEILG